MSKTFSDLSLDELNSIGAEAGTEAMREAHAAGLAVPGMSRIRLASGEDLNILTSLHPDGTLEILDPRIMLFSEKTGKSEVLMKKESPNPSYMLQRYKDAPKPVGKKRIRA